MLLHVTDRTRTASFACTAAVIVREIWLWLKTAFDNIQSQRQIFLEDILNKTNELKRTNELKAKFTVVYLTY